ncbi:MAG: DUF4393 domain-containing protein, partial [Prevotella sp.]|nr:DUF4393 domain-containing protein [Prevotella sp.]
MVCLEEYCACRISGGLDKDNTIREMYEEMLAKAMDNRKVHQVHRSYVDAVKQMEPLDAQVLRR